LTIHYFSFGTKKTKIAIVDRVWSTSFLWFLHNTIPSLHLIIGATHDEASIYKQGSTPSKVIKIHLNPKIYTRYTSKKTLLFF